MRIGFVVDNEFNGDARVIREAKILSTAGHQVFVLCFGYKGKSYPSIEGLEISRIKISKRRKDALYFAMNILPFYEMLWSSRIKRFIVDNSLDALHVHDLYMSKSGFEGIKKSGKKIPLTLDLHENYPEAVLAYNWTKGLFRQLIAKPRKWKQKEKEYLSYADTIVALSQNLIDYINDTYSFTETKFVAFPNILDPAEIGPIKEPSVEIKLGPPIFLYFGAVAERRGIFEALEALKSILDSGEEASMLVIGPVDKKDQQLFEEYLDRPSLKSRTQYIPWIELSELNSIMNICIAGLAPFRKNKQHESGVANKIFQYMAGAIPVIASDCKPQVEIIKKYSCGKIFKNEDELISIIKWVIRNPDECKQLGLKGKEAIASQFNIRNYESQLLEIYSE